MTTQHRVWLVSHIRLSWWRHPTEEVTDSE